jgi:Zn-dependent protease with chaperone function
MIPPYGFGPQHSLLFFLFFSFFATVISILVIIPYWFIFKKAGFSPFLALLMFIPLINIVMLYVLAFSRWNVVPAAQVYAAPPSLPYQPRA